MRSILTYACAALLLIGCAGSGTGNRGETTLTVESIAAAEAAAMVERGEAVLVDVRERGEIQRGMAEPAYWIPLSMIQREEAPWVNFVKDTKKHPDRLVILYCESGGRSNFVGESLNRLSIRAANLGNYA